jgi:hypothetical protein
MGIIYNGIGIRNNITDPENNFSGNVAIRVRGSSSRYFFDKLNYSVELQNDAGDDTSLSILGMPKESDWVLHGPYSDKALMRNALMYQLGENTGHYAPRTRFCEVMLNDDYIGVYSFVERIKRDKNRVNVDKISTFDNSGGYIIKVDRGEDFEKWESGYTPYNNYYAKIFFVYDYPKPEEITDDQKNYIQNFMLEFENTLYGGSFNDALTGYSQYINTQSFIDYFILSEISRNIDAYRLSAFMYKERDSQGGKLYAGPLWDYDLAFGNANYDNGGNIDGYAYEFNYINPGNEFLVPFWWQRFLDDPNYCNQLRCRWESLREGPLQIDAIDAVIDSFATKINEAQARNFTRWPVLGTYVWPNIDPESRTTYSDEINYLKDWIAERIYWLDDNIPGEATNCPTGIENTNTIAYFEANVFPNPIDNNSYLSFNITKQANLTIEIYNSIGQQNMLFSNKMFCSGEHKVHIKTDALTPGIHLLIIKENERKVYSTKLIKL